MKRKWKALLATLLCVACLPVMPLSANAQIGSYDDPFVSESDLFTYNHGAFQKISEEVLPYEYFSMITGICYSKEGTEPVAYIVEGFSRLYLDREKGEYVTYPDGGLRSDEPAIWSVNDFGEYVDKTTFEVGDLLVLSGWLTQASFPGRIYPFVRMETTVKYIGNATEVIGEDSMKAVKHEVAESIAYMSRANVVVDDSLIVNGDATEDEEVTVVDVLATNKYLLGVQNFGSYSKLASDVNKDGAITDSDCMTILKSLVGLAELQ